MRGRWKLKVSQIVYAAFSRDEIDMGFGFPKAERDGLIASDPETFFLPPTSDLRYQWVCVHLDRIDDAGDARAGDRRLADVHAARCCTTCPSMPAPAMAAYGFLDAGEYGELRPLLHPYVHFTDGAVTLRGRTQGARPPARAPDARARRRDPSEIRDGQIYRWDRSELRFRALALSTSDVRSDSPQISVGRPTISP